MRSWLQCRLRCWLPWRLQHRHADEIDRWRILPILAWTIVLAWFFAHIEIEIEGGAGWATNLPTWRVEKHWLLDLFWGGRAMTGYHAWMFPFITLFFHFPFCAGLRWSWRAECRAVACIMVFWITEDMLWFVLNPAWGLARFHAGAVPWHKHWIGGLPTDYWTFAAVAMVLLRAAVRGAAQIVPVNSDKTDNKREPSP